MGGSGGNAGGTGGAAGADAGTGGFIDVDGGGTGGGSAGTGGTAGSGGVEDAGCQPPVDVPVPEVCGNGLDDDLNGFIDEGCLCSIGETQTCFGGTPSQSTQPNCTMGTQTCVGSTEFPGWGACEGWQCGPTPPPAEICDNGEDDDCDGQVDEGCDLTVTVSINGDCVWGSCPPQAPYPVGCDIIMSGNDPRGCIANDGTALVYFQEGDNCGAGHVDGTLQCSSQPSVPAGQNPLNAGNCVINKNTQFYPTDPGGCPAT